MTQPEGELLDLTNPRYWRQNAQMAVRDVYDALIELITNADDRYVYLRAKCGRIEIEVERRRKGLPGLIRVRDFADGMTLEVMKKKLKRIADRISGMAEGIPVRGTNSRGAKDVAILGRVIFESIAGDGQYHKCEITAQGRFIAHGSEAKNIEKHRESLKIKEATGTVVSLLVDPEVTRIPQHETLKSDLRQLIALRDILHANDREIVLRDLNNAREDILKAPVIEGHDRLSERLSVPGYEGVEAKLIIKRARRQFEDRRPKFRLGGILVKSKHAIHEATLFAPELEHDPHAQWFYGRLTCEFIDELWNQYDDRLERGLSPERKNPRSIFDPLRKEGLSREHPFVDALFKEALRRLRPLVEAERKQADSTHVRIESDETRKRLRALEKAAAQFMSENHLEDEDESAQNADSDTPDSDFIRTGFSLNPPFAQIILGHSIRFWLNIKQSVLPEFATGDQVEISCLSDEISSSKRFASIEAHPGQEGVLRCVWSVKGEKTTKASGVKVRIGSIVADRCVEVLESEREKYRDIDRFCFHRKRYTLQVGKSKAVILLAPYPALISERTPINIECSSASFKIGGEKVLVPYPELGVAKCKLKVTTSASDKNAELKATIPGHCCSSQLLSIDPLGSPITIELKDEAQGNYRSRWLPGTNTLRVCTRHPSITRYLSPPKFPEQNETHFRVLLAEIVADAVITRIISRKVQAHDEYFAEADWESYYASYSELMTKFLPIAHETQVKL